MTTFKHGDRVTCEISGTKILDAKISIDSDGFPFICQNAKDGSNTENKLGYKYSWWLDKDFTDCEVSNLRLAGPKMLDDIEVGDVLLDKRAEYPVIFRSGELVVFKYSKGYTSPNYTISQLKENGFTVKQPAPETPAKKMTVAEIAKQLGHEVEIIEG